MGGASLSAFWVYVRFQLMCFVFGIVGPIFLIGYFAVQPDPTVKWMYWWGLFITAFDVLCALWLTNNVLKADDAKRKERESRVHTRPTVAENVEDARRMFAHRDQ